MRRIMRLAGVVCLFGCLLASLPVDGPVQARARLPTQRAAQVAAPDLPTVNPDYIYDQLDYLTSHFQRREAGYGAGQGPNANGHDAFAAYWAQEMTRQLAGFGVAVRRDAFKPRGWRGRPPTSDAFNVEVSVPGLTHPEQEVVIGCHYDGEASSTQSANDDASGCAIELGVAQAMASYWRAKHVYPARTLRFVAFDAEEQGLDGSFHYVNATANGDLRNVVAMVNEEQSGIAYPLRYLGRAANPQLPFYADVSPLAKNDLYPNQAALSADQRARITRFREALTQQVGVAFGQFRALGDGALAYRDASGAQASQPVFQADQTSNVTIDDDYEGSSDQVPFTLAGAPCVTFLGNATYYDRNNPPPWSYPYDQPDDTLQLMNTFASGSAQKAQALTFSLALPGMLTVDLLAQPDILGAAPADGAPLAAISSVGQPRAGQPLALDAQASFDPAGRPLGYAWDFGDGATAAGQSVTHTYTQPGDFTLALTVTSPGGTRRVAKSLAIAQHPPGYPNAFTGLLSGRPQANPAVTLPTPGPQAQAASGAAHPVTHPGARSDGPPFALLAGLLALIALAGALGATLYLRARRPVALASTLPDASLAEARDRRAEALRRLAHEQLGEQPAPGETPDTRPAREGHDEAGRLP